MNSQPLLEFPVTLADTTCYIQLPLHLTVVEAVGLKATCQKRVKENPALTQIVLDFRQTVFLDSSGIGALVTCSRVASQAGIPICLRHVKPEIRAIFTLADLEDAFVIEAETTIAGSPAVSSAESLVPHPSIRSRSKRLIDIAGALIGLGITAVIVLPIAVAIQLDNPGPLFFCQTRCGFMGKRFKLWKFRSMVADAEARKSQVENQVQGAFFKNENDPRITRVGRFLRKTSLDELPQFWNVLTGDMSLVGTRPPTPDEIELYEVPNWQRLDVKPGMTGEWQVHGRSTVKTFAEVIELDLRYQERWSLAYDLHLIVKTVLVLFSSKTGAF
jgi:anti-anti-sigma factor